MSAESPSGDTRSVPATRGRLRRAAIIGLVVLALLVVAFSRSFGRAETIGSYRPELPAPALDNGCWPLPDGLSFDFAYQVRTDGDVAAPGGDRRHLVMQYDLVDAPEAAAALTASFEQAGFVAGQSAEPGHLVFVKRGFGAVDATVTPLPGIAADSIVRGTIVLDLPATPSAADPSNPWCDNPYSTKRFPADWKPAT